MKQIFDLSNITKSKLTMYIYDDSEIFPVQKNKKLTIIYDNGVCYLKLVEENMKDILIKLNAEFYKSLLYKIKDIFYLPSDISYLGNILELEIINNNNNIKWTSLNNNHNFINKFQNKYDYYVDYIIDFIENNLNIII